MIHRELKGLDLTVKITTNIKQVDFLDVTVSLNNSSFQPIMKANPKAVYLRPNFNHSRPVIKQIRSSIEFRISADSYSKEVFNKRNGFQNFRNSA